MHRSLALAIGFALLGSVAVVGFWLLARSPAAPTAPSPTAQPAPGAPAAPVREPALQRVRPLDDLAPPPPAQGDATERITGLVVAGDGQPVAGATVTLYRQLSSWPEWRGAMIDQALTERDGRFRFRFERGPDLLVGVEHPEFVGELVEASPALPELVFRLQRGFEVSGTVTNDSGLPMANVFVAMESTLVDTRRARTTTTGNNGRFRFANVPGGTVRLVARHEWWQPAVLPAVAVGVDRSVELRFDRPAQTLEGRVLMANTQEPVEGAEVLAVPPGQQIGRNEPARTLTRADGTFRLTGLPRGTMRVEVRHPDHAVTWRTLVVGLAGRLVLELASRCAVAGRLQAAGDVAAFTGARLLLRAADDELAHATVAADGTFLFPRRMTPGWAHLSVVDGRFAFLRSASKSLRLRLEEGGSEHLQLEVAAPAVVTGRVVGEDGAAIAGARVSVTQAELFTQRLLQVGNALLERDLRKVGDQIARSAAVEPEVLLAVTAADGRFRIAGLPPGPVPLRFEHPGHGSRQLAVEVPQLGQNTPGQDVVLSHACRIAGRVLRGGRSLAGAQVGVDAGGLSITAVTGLDGRCELTDLPPGTYRVRVRYSTLPTVVSDAVTVTPASPADVELAFPPGRMVRGTVTGSDGQPVEGAMVLVRGAGGSPALTDAGGNFVVEVPDRDLELQVLYGDRGARQVVPVAADAAHVTITIDTPPNCTLTAQVLGLPGRKQLPGVLVRVARADNDGTTPVQSRWIEMQGGQLRHPWMPAGQWRVTIWSEDYAPCVRDVDLKGGEESSLGEILLEPGCTLRGRVVDEAGQPVAGAGVFLGEEVDLDVFDPTVRSGPDGSFVVRGVSTAAPNLLVRATGYAWQLVPLALPRDVLAKEPLAVRLERGATVEVAVAQGTGAAGSIVLLRRQGRVLASAEAGDDGRARFTNCGPGDYVVQRFGDDHARAVAHVTQSGQVVQVDLR